MLPIAVTNTKADERLIHVFLHEVLTREVDHWTCVANLVNNKERGDAGILGHLGVVGTKCGGDVDNTRTILGCYIIARNHTESVGLLIHDLAILQRTGLNPGEELFVTDVEQVRSFVMCQHFELAFLKVCGEAALG